MAKFVKTILFVAIALFIAVMFMQNCSLKENPTDSLTKTKIEYNTKRFYNPISEATIADPFITYDSKTQYYYGLYTMGDRLEIFRYKHAAELFVSGESKVIYRPNGEDGIWGDIWAPEMHRGSDGTWYVYASGRITPEPNGEKRIFAIASLSSDPFGDWEYIGMPAPDVFSIDPAMYTAHDGTQYMCYSKVHPEYGQVLEIARMVSPGVCGTGTTIARAELEWELVEPYVGSRAILEGAFFLENNGRLFIIYSANGCWSNHYALGVLEYIGGDFCSSDSWKKSSEPLLEYGNGVYGPGHASFFRSPDGTEVWCAYHGMKNSNDEEVPEYRFCNIQKVEFDFFGYPIMGQPIGSDTPIDPPSGEIK